MVVRKWNTYVFHILCSYTVLLFVGLLSPVAAEAGTMVPMPEGVRTEDNMVSLQYEAAFLEERQITVEIANTPLESSLYRIDLAKQALVIDQAAFEQVDLKKGVEVLIGAAGYEEKRHFILKGEPLGIYITVTYQSNNGASAVERVYQPIHKKFQLAGKLFAWDDAHGFTGWTLQADGSGEAYKANAMVAFGEDTTLFAKWVPMYRVIFDANGGTINGETTQTTYTIEGKACNYIGDSAYPGMTLIGWNTSRDGTGKWVSAENGFFTSQSITFYAQWAPQQPTLTFDANKGQGTMPSITVARGENVDVPKNAFKRKGYQFTGWNTLATGKGTSYKAGDSLTLVNHCTLYAQWRSVPASATRPIVVPHRYEVVTADAPHGKLALTNNALRAGAIGSITVLPEEGYILEQLAIETLSGKTVPFTALSKTHYQWQMPREKVFIKATFKAKAVQRWNRDYSAAFVHGYADGTVRPLNILTRAEATSLLWPFINQAQTATKKKAFPFGDVASKDWSYPSVMGLYQCDIIDDSAKDAFAPDAPITRGEFITWCVRMAKEQEKEVLSHFKDTEDHWAAKDIAYAKEEGWIRGYEDGLFYPDRALRRVEAMAILNRMTGRDVKKPEAFSYQAADNTPEAWYYEIVQLATNACS